MLLPKANQQPRCGRTVSGGRGAGVPVSNKRDLKRKFPLFWRHLLLQLNNSPLNLNISEQSRACGISRILLSKL
jgi:hypothetical protein